MAKKPTYEELEQRVKELEEQTAERKEVENAILQTKQDWERTFDAVPDLIAILDDKHRINRVNKAMADRLGVSLDGAVGLTCYEHVHGTKEPPPFCPHVKLLVDGQRHIAEICEERLGGDFLVSVSPLHDAEGKLIGSVHVAHDITRRKKAEEALRESEREFRELVELLPQTVFEMDANTNVRFTNRHGFASFGYSQEDLEKGLSALQLFVPEDLDGLKENIEKILGGKEPEDNEYTALREDGSTFPVIVYSSRIHGDGKPTGVRGLIIDITERKRIEEERVQIERLQGVVEMAGAVCHELSQPMQVISTYSELLMAGMMDDNALHGITKKIKAQIDRMGEVTRKLIRITKYETMDYLFEGEKIVDIDKASAKGK